MLRLSVFWVLLLRHDNCMLIIHTYLNLSFYLLLFLVFCPQTFFLNPYMTERASNVIINNIN